MVFVRTEPYNADFYREERENTCSIKISYIPDNDMPLVMDVTRSMRFCNIQCALLWEYDFDIVLLVEILVHLTLS